MDVSILGLSIHFIAFASFCIKYGAIFYHFNTHFMVNTLSLALFPYHAFSLVIHKGSRIYEAFNNEMKTRTTLIMFTTTSITYNCHIILDIFYIYIKSVYACRIVTSIPS